MRRSLTRTTAAATAATLAVSLLTVTPTMADEEDPSSAGDSTSETEELDALALAEQAGEPVETTSLTDEKTRHYLGVCR